MDGHFYQFAYNMLLTLCMVSHIQTPEDVNTSMTDTPTRRSITKGKGTYSIWKRTKAKFKVDIDADYKKFVGANATKFINELGVHLKRDAPVEAVSGWNQIDKGLKESIIKSSLEKFEIEGGINDKVIEIIHSTCKGIYTNWKSKAHQHYKETLAKGLNPYQHPYPTMSTNNRYAYMIDNVWNSDKFKKRSDINKRNRDNVKYNHTTGSNSFAAALHFEGQDNVSDEIDYIEFFKSRHYNKKTNRWVDQRAEEDYMELKEQRDKANELGIDMPIEEIFEQVFGKEFSYFGKKPSSTRSNVSNKQDKEKMQRLQDQLDNLAKTSEEKIEAQQKIIEDQNKKMEEFMNSQREFMRNIVILYPQSGNRSFSSAVNPGGDI